LETGGERYRVVEEFNRERERENEWDKECEKGCMSALLKFLNKSKIKLIKWTVRECKEVKQWLVKS